MSAGKLPVLIAEWPRNNREAMRVRLDEYQGNAVIDVRVWYPAPAGWKPGRAGLTIGVRHLAPLSDALAKALAEARRLNLVPPAG